MKTSTRNWILAIVFLGLLAGLGLGTLYVLKRGARKRGLYERAVVAFNAEDYETTELHLRTLLRTDPDNLAAFQMLSVVMYKQGKLAELGDYIREWVVRAKNPEFGWQALVELEFAQGRFREAERIARAHAEDHPLLVQRVVMVARDIAGTVADRLAAVEAARRIATLAENEYTIADAHLFAGEMLLELAPFFKDPQRAEFVVQGEAHLAEAAKAARQAAKRQPGAQYDALMAVLNLHSGKESEIEAGVRWMSMRFAAVKDSRPREAEQIRAHLVAHFLRQKDWTQAETWSKGLENAAFTTMLRTLRRFQEAGRDAEALALIELIAPDRRVTPVRLTRAQILLRGDEAQRAAGVEEIRSVLDSIDPTPSLVAGLFTTLLRAGETEPAFEILNQIRKSHPDQRFDALFAAAAARQEGREAEVLDIARDLGSRDSEPAVALDVVRLLAQSNREALFKYLEGQVLLPGASGSRFLSLRSSLNVELMRRTEDETERAKLRDAAVADLRGLLDRPECPLVILEAVGWRAVQLNEPVLGGRFLARAIEAAPALAGLPTGVFRNLKALGQDARAAQVVEGIRGGAESSAIKDLLLGVADAATADADGMAAVRQRLGSVEPGAPGELRTLHFLTALCALESDWQEAENHARRILRLEPDSEQADRLLGAVLLRQGRFEDVLELHKGTEKPSPSVFVQSVDALLALDRNEDALATARRFASEWPQVPAGMFVLARVHTRLGDYKNALGVLSASPPSRNSEILRGELLERLKQYVEAERVYRRMIRASVSDRGAWQGLYRVQVQSRPDHVELFTAAASVAIGEKAIQQDAGTRAAILTLRAMAFEKQGRPGPALEDYEEAIRLTKNNSTALNNVAWLLMDTTPERIDDAVKFVESALELAPGSTEISDTAANVYFKAGKYGRARELSERALELIQPLVESDPETHKVRERRFRILHARILERLGEKEEAIAELKEIRKESAEDPEGRDAGSLLESFGAD